VTRVRVNQAGVRRMLAAQYMQDEMERRMERVRLLAMAIAPVLSGRYKGRFERPGAIETGVNERGVAFARLSNDATSDEGFMYAEAVEVGNEHVNAHHTLETALHAAVKG
jgi:hypothetical protein